MAIYHLTASTGSRKNGQSAAAKLDYIQRSGKYSRDPDECLYTESGNMPDFAKEAADYWSGADTYERANGRLFKQVEFALPRELSPDAQRELASEFAQEIAGKELPYSLAIHAGKGTNPHCHLMISERINDGVDRPRDQWFRRHNSKEPERGGAKKSARLKPKKWLIETRERWAELANQALERADLSERIDHRTLEAQGIERVPGVHLGPNVAAMAARGISTDRADMAAEVEAANRRIADLVDQRDAVDRQMFKLEDEIIRNQPTLDDRIAASFERHLAAQEHADIQEKIRRAQPLEPVKVREVVVQDTGVKWTQYVVSDADIQRVDYPGPTPTDDQIHEKLSQRARLSKPEWERAQRVQKALQNHALDEHSGLHLPKDFRRKLAEIERQKLKPFVEKTFGKVIELEARESARATHVGTIVTHLRGHHVMSAAPEKIILLSDIDVKKPMPGREHFLMRQPNNTITLKPMKARDRDNQDRGFER